MIIYEIPNFYFLLNYTHLSFFVFQDNTNEEVNNSTAPNEEGEDEDEQEEEEPPLERITTSGEVIYSTIIPHRNTQLWPVSYSTPGLTPDPPPCHQVNFILYSLSFIFNLISFPSFFLIYCFVFTS